MAYTPGGSAAGLATFPPGFKLGSRYTIIKLLGRGGMGAVYQAWDDELMVPVAIKTILQDADGDEHATHAAEARFKRELVLARQVTHKNVVRIHDLGDVDGQKYITMSFVEGETLGHLLKRIGPLPVAQALGYARQIADGLAAAHEVGIVHRDLKPENVMITPEGQALIMDFGIARGNAGTTATQAGVIMGTLEYMAPEQAAGHAVDHRADIYAFGLMLYDMLLGRGRTKGRDNPMTELLNRVQRAPDPPRATRAEIPEALEQIVMSCVQPDLDGRPQTTAALVDALARLAPDGNPRKDALPAERLGKRAVIAIAAALVLSVAGAAWYLSSRIDPPPVVQREPVSVLIADFQNDTGDPVFSGAVEDALGLGIEGASFITAFPRRDAVRAAQQIRPDGELDETTARLVCQREGIKTMIAGAITADGNRFRVTVRALDPVPGTVLAEESEVAPGKADVLKAVERLSAKIRRALGDLTPETAMATARETFTAASLEAARDYAKAQDLANANRDEEAIVLYERAIQADPQLGRAYSGRAASAFKLGRKAEAEEYYKKAFALVDRMTEREKFRTLGTYYLNIAGNYDLAIENYESLLAKYPADGAGHNNLALAYFHRLEFAKAMAEGKQLLAIYPKSALYSTNQALYAMYAGEFAVSTDAARAALEISPNQPKAHVAIAMAALANGQPEEARASYERAHGTGARGVSLATIGIADLLMYQGKFDAAIALLAPGITVDQQGKNTAGAAAKAVALAQAEYARGNQAAAVAAIERARSFLQDPAVLVPAAELFVAMGRTADVTKIADQLEGALAPRSRAYGRVVRAMMAVDRGRAAEAIQLLEEAQKVADLWLVRFYKGIAYVNAGAHAEALSQLQLCERRRGETTALFLDDMPTFRAAVPLNYWLGRAHEALGAGDAAQRHFRAYLSLRSPATDPLARDAERRVAGK